VIAGVAVGYFFVHFVIAGSAILAYAIINDCDQNALMASLGFLGDKVRFNRLLLSWLMALIGFGPFTLLFAGYIAAKYINKDASMKRKNTSTTPAYFEEY